MATEKGIVIRTDSSGAWVKTVRSSACEACASKDSCQAMGGDDMEVKVINEIGAAEGDRIVLNLRTASLLKATFLLYVFPILVLIAGAIVGQQSAPFFGFNPNGFSVVVGFSFFIAAVLIVKISANRMAKKNEYRPKIVKIIK